jgi:hypothetical protein
MSKRVQEIVRETLNVKHLGKTKDKSFYYEDKGLVPAGLEYHAHYTRGGQIFYMTGKSHDKTSKIINPIYPIDVQDDKQKYQLLSNNFNFVNSVVSGKTKPTNIDYKKGFFVRYFAKKVGDSIPFEIKKGVVDVDSLYQYESIFWKLTGDRTKVMEANRQAVLIADKNFRGLKKLITNYIKYYK